MSNHKHGLIKNVTPVQMSSILHEKIHSSYSPELSNFLADKYLNAEGDFLGSGWVSKWKGMSALGFLGGSYPNDEDFRPEITWQRDVKSGFTWDITKPSSDQLQLGLKAQGADVKVAWEFARMHQYLRLALIDREEAPSIMKERIHDFMEANPIGMGVNWMNAMEVSIRAINLMVAFDLLGWNEKKESKIIQDHLQFILNNLERKEGLGNNHYLANLLGLLFGLTYFPEWGDLATHKKFIIKEFVNEVDKQFFNDGGNFEGSTYYHALSTEIAVLGLACLQKLEITDAISSIQDKVLKAHEFLKVIQKPNGELPQYGDNDSGRILPLSANGEWLTPEQIEQKYAHLKGYASFTKDETQFVENALDVSGIVAFGEALFYGEFNGTEGGFIQNFTSSLQSKLKIGKGELNEDLGMALQEHKKWEIPFEHINVSKLTSHYFEDFGIAVIKSPEFYLSISLLKRRKAHRYRGHFHNDQLSIDVWAHGNQLVADPGNVTYTGDMQLRNDLRSAKAHNAPYLGEEPNRFMDGIIGLFHTMDETNVELYELTNQKIRAALFYKNEKVIRSVEIHENGVVVRDSASRSFVVNKKNSIMSDGYGRILRE